MLVGVSKMVNVGNLASLVEEERIFLRGVDPGNPVEVDGIE